MPVTSFHFVPEYTYVRSKAAMSVSVYIIIIHAYLFLLIVSSLTYQHFSVGYRNLIQLYRYDADFRPIFITCTVNPIPLSSLDIIVLR